MRAEQGEGINSHEEKLYLNSQTPDFFFSTISEGLTFHILHAFWKTVILLDYYFSAHFHKNEVDT